MKIYELPELQIEAFEIEDIITTSNTEPVDTQPEEGPELPGI